MSLHKLQDYLETATKESDISEEAYLKISEYMKTISADLRSLEYKVNLLNNEARLDLIEILFEETKEAMDTNDFECVYHDLCYEQFRKLRNPIG